MSTPKDDIRPLGAVEAKCSQCGWHFWLDPLDDQLPDGLFVCWSCVGKPDTGEKVDESI